MSTILNGHLNMGKERVQYRSKAQGSRCLPGSLSLSGQSLYGSWRRKDGRI